MGQLIVTMVTLAITPRKLVDGAFTLTRCYSLLGYQRLCVSGLNPSHNVKEISRVDLQGCFLELSDTLETFTGTDGFLCFAYLNTWFGNF